MNSMAAGTIANGGLSMKRMNPMETPSRGLSMVLKQETHKDIDAKRLFLDIFFENFDWLHIGAARLVHVKDLDNL